VGVPIDGFMHLKKLGEPKASPDGRSVAFAVNEVDLEKDGYRSSIYLYRDGEKNAEPFTAGPKDSSPAWSPDGATLAFLSARGEDKDPQIYVMPVGGGEARRLTSDLKGADALAWSPDGTTLSVVAWREVPEPETEALWKAVDAAGGFKPDSERTASLILTARLKYRFDGVGYFHDRRRHVRTVPAAGGEGRWVTEGAFDVAFYAWHPGGRTLTIATTLVPDVEAGNREEAYEVDAGGGELRLLASTGGRVAGFAWSPDGETLALIGTDNSAGPASSPRLWLLERGASGPRRLLATLDRPIGPGLHGDTTPMGPSSPLAWAAGGDRLYFAVHDGGNVRTYALDLERPDTLVDLLPAGWSGNAGAFALTGGRLWCVIEDATHPAEVWELGLGGGPAAPVRRTDLSTSTVEAWGVQPTEAIRYEGPGGVEIEAFVVRPAGFREGERYPLFLLVHGGPHGAYGRSFSHEVQRHVSEGRIVLMVNPRGSTGYSQDFAHMCIGEWGGGDYGDIMAGVDELIGRGWVDPSRMAVNGISYGGYMTSWILTHTDRFACAIPEMLISNMVSMFGNSDISYYMMAVEAPGTPWDGPQHLWEHSPLAHVGNASTPTLLIQGEVDYRCPIGQAEELFVSLRTRGIDAVLVRLQGASHGGSRIGPPRQRLARKVLIQQWLERYGVATPTPAAEPVVTG
jgi:dipeptidyl aminopeptidase/acylaminoacyl peptidase